MDGRKLLIFRNRCCETPRTQGAASSIVLVWDDEAGKVFIDELALTDPAIKPNRSSTRVLIGSPRVGVAACGSIGGRWWEMYC
jgi:hypothetical protein